MISEAALVLLAAAIYLADCVVLLERGQALLETGWRGATLSFGSKHYQIAGKSVALMNPLTPFVPAFRTLPLFSGSPGTRLSSATQANALLFIPAAMQFFLVFLALPYCLYRAPGWPFLIALALAYLNAIAMLVLLALRFKKHSISARPLAGLGFGWIACLPLSVNCLRAAGVSFPLAFDARQALRFVRGDARQRAAEELAAQATEAMHELEEDDGRFRRLSELARELLSVRAGTNGRL